jgi:hypothetical protein
MGDDPVHARSQPRLVPGAETLADRALRGLRHATAIRSASGLTLARCLVHNLLWPVLPSVVSLQEAYVGPQDQLVEIALGK